MVYLLRIYNEPRTRGSPELLQMYGNTPNNGNYWFTPTLTGNFGTLIYLSEEYPRSLKFRVDEILWVITPAISGLGGYGPVFIELEGD